MPRRILLVGASGMLGRAIQSQLRSVEFATVSGRDLANGLPQIAIEKVSAIAPEIIINCAADTDVEGSERDSRRAVSANAFLPDILAQAAVRHRALLVHFSSTGCYGAYKSEPYDDYDVLRPTTVHHRAKAAGEEAIRASNCRHLIIRLGWLYGGAAGEHKKNFVWNRICEAKGQRRLYSDPSQMGNPTNVDDVARQILHLLKIDLTGTFNCVAQGVATRLEYVSAIVARADPTVTVQAGSFMRDAPVSSNESAINLKLSLGGWGEMPHWRDGLDRYLTELLQA